MKKVLIFCILFVSLIFTHGEGADSSWFDSRFHVSYRGYFGENTGGLVLVFDGDDVVGELYFDSDYKDIPLSGKIQNERDIELTSEDGIILKGRFMENDPEYLSVKLDKEVIKGKVTNEGNNSEFYVSLVTASAGDLQHKYSIAGFENDQELNEFAVKFKEAVISGNKRQVSMMLGYPTLVNLKNGSERRIESREEFLRIYDDIFYPEFLDSFRKAIPHNMFSKSSGVLLTSDDSVFWIWFHPWVTEDKGIGVVSIFSK